MGAAALCEMYFEVASAEAQRPADLEMAHCGRHVSPGARSRRTVLSEGDQHDARPESPFASFDLATLPPAAACTLSQAVGPRILITSEERRTARSLSPPGCSAEKRRYMNRIPRPVLRRAARNKNSA